MARKSSTFGELIALLFAPVVWLLRPFIGRKRANPGLVKWFYKTPEWKRLRYAHLAQYPACALCGRSAKDGARMNVDHIKPLSRHWNLRLAPHNLQTLCAACNHGKGGKTADHRGRRV
jgi:5-methylcytosine-specific restriction endonuclease McrA